jgi:phenylacetate-CoA ligase
MDAAENIESLRLLLRSYPVAYIQAYPSSLFNFLREIESSGDREIRALIRSKVRACLLSSEYPVPYMARYIREQWELDYLSWYGHSEMCVLALDRYSSGHYRPLLTYGLGEVCDGVLCGTSFNNVDMPLIRYATGDHVVGEQDGAGLLNAFTITEGRSGDFVQDRSGRSLSLTSLLFGRHHEIFDVADYVQVSQAEPGKLVVWVTLKPGTVIEPRRLSELFDERDVDFGFSYRILRKPILSTSGKLQVLVPADGHEGRGRDQ